MACEDEYLPGRQQSVDEEGDERRLLYVSLMRARERLFITYAHCRIGQQQHTGRDSGKQKRTLTRYLRNAPIHATPGAKFFETPPCFSTIVRIVHLTEHIERSFL